MSDISNVSNASKDVTFKIYKIDVDDLLVESVSDLAALFSIGYHQYTARESDQSLQKLVKSSTKNSISPDLCLDEYIKYRNGIRFPKDNSLIGIKSLMKTIELDFGTISYSRQNDDNFYALGPIHFVICCILKGCNAIVTSDMINYLLDIIVNQNNSFNLPDKLEDIGEYCNINNLSAINSLISLDNGKSSSSSMMTFDLKFLRDPNEDQNNLIALLKRILEIRETDTSNLSLMIKLNSIEKIVKDLINENESVVVQYNSRFLDEEYCHTLKGPLIASLVSIVNSNGFDPEKEVDIQCFPTNHKNNNTILDSIIRFKYDRSDFARLRSNENLVRANRYSQEFLCFDKILDLANASTITNMKKILSLFGMIDSHNQLIVLNDMIILDRIDEIDLLKIIQTKKLSFLECEKVNSIVDELKFSSMGCNPYSIHLVSANKSNDASILYLLDIVGWLNHQTEIDKFLNKNDFDQMTYSNLLKLTNNSELDIIMMSISTLHPGIIFRLMKSLIEIDSSYSYIFLTDLVLERLIINMDELELEILEILDNDCLLIQNKLEILNDYVRAKKMDWNFDNLKSIDISPFSHKSLKISYTTFMIFAIRLVDLISQELNTQMDLFLESIFYLCVEKISSDNYNILNENKLKSESD